MYCVFICIKLELKVETFVTNSIYTDAVTPTNTYDKLLNMIIQSDYHLITC